jgi:hypothetical protein
VGLVVLQWVVTALCAVAALWLVVLLVRDLVPGRALLNVMAAIAVLLVVHLVVGVVHVLGAPSGVPRWEYAGYLLGTVLIIPAGVIWSSGERSRGGTGVLLVATLVVPFMFLRLAEIWSTGG